MNLSDYAIGGGTRPDAISGLNADFAAALQNLLASAPPDIAAQLRISSAYRSPEIQAKLYQDALAKYGSPEAARKWVAPPGKSQHNHGMAADLKYLSPAAQAWAHENAAKFGLAFPLSNENWHIELATARGDQRGAPGAPATMADMYGSTRPAAGLAEVPQVAESAAMGSAPLTALTMLFEQQQQRKRDEEQAAQAEQERRRALFAPPAGVAGLYG